MADVQRLTSDQMPACVSALSEILVACVAGGAAISFILPFTTDDAERFWLDEVMPQVAADRRSLFVAELSGRVVGAVQLITALPPNQPHRCEVAKMIVHPDARRRGVARCLMTAAEARARALGKTLMTLDTRTNDNAEPLYRSLGFEPAGVIPDFGLDVDGSALHATLYMYKRL